MNSTRLEPTVMTVEANVFIQYSPRYNKFEFLIVTLHSVRNLDTVTDAPHTGLKSPSPGLEKLYYGGWGGGGWRGYAVYGLRITIHIIKK